MRRTDTLLAVLHRNEGRSQTAHTLPLMSIVGRARQTPTS